MKRLRGAREEDLARDRPHAPSREELRELAARFPGALAEIDRLSPALLEARYEEARASLDRERAPLPTWVIGWIGVHRGLRGALSIKARLAGKRSIDEATRAAIEEGRAIEEEDDWRDRLEVIANPPRGRLVDVVMARVAEELAIDPGALRELLLPTLARSR